MSGVVWLRVVVHIRIGLRTNYPHLPEGSALARVIALIIHASNAPVYQLANQHPRGYMPCLHCYKVDIILQLTPLQLKHNHTPSQFLGFHCEALRQLTVCAHNSRNYLRI